jgi:hypothetical protein
MILRLSAIVGLSILVLGCSEPKLDGTSESAMKASVEKVSASLDSTKKGEFQEAIKIVAFSEMDLGAVLKGDKDAAGMAGQMYSALDGKTAEEVIAKAALIKAERAAREKSQALEEIAELEAKLKQAETAKSELAKFVVSRSRFYLRDKEYTHLKEPIIELSVQNGTSHPISRAFFKGTISSPGRSIPWFSDDFNYSISGGLEPGESADWGLAPNMFSDWGKVDAPVDAVFTVEVVRVDGPDGKPLFDASGLNERQVNRLATLKEQYLVN